MSSFYSFFVYEERTGASHEFRFSDPMLGPSNWGVGDRRVPWYMSASRKELPTWFPPTMNKVQIANTQTCAILVAAGRQNITGYEHL